MQKIKYFTSLYYSVLFFCSKRLNSTHYLIMKINDKRKLQNILINHSADIDYQNFIKIYRERTKEPYFFFTIDTLPASHPLKFTKRIVSFL